MSVVLSIIVAAYNVENYIEKTLDSLIVPEVMDEIEVLVINDGSTDNTASIVEKYTSLYPKVFKLINKANGGHGSVLNRGIDEATGKYYRPIDGDDWVDQDALKFFVSTLKKIDADMVLSHYVEVYEKSEKVKKIKIKNVYSVGQIKRGVQPIQKGDREICIYGKVYDFNKDLFDFSDLYKFHFITYRTELLKKNKIRMTEKCFYDDMEYDLYPLPYVKTVSAVDCYLYQYRLEREGQSVHPKSFIKNSEMRKTITINTTKYFIENRSTFGKNVCNHLEYETIFRIQRQYEIYMSFEDLAEASDKMLEFDQIIKKIDEGIYQLSANNDVAKLRKHNFDVKTIEKIKKHNTKIKNKKRPAPWSIRSDIPMHKEIIRRYILKYTGLARFNKEMCKLRNFKNIHAGERCFITCTGPSLTIPDLEMLKNEITIGVNSITLAYPHTDWRPTYYALIDVYSFDKYLKESDIKDGYCKDTAFFHYRAKPSKLFGNELFVPINYLNHYKKMMEKNKIIASGDISVCIYDCFTVTIMAIQIAMYMGFKEIYLLGADCNYNSNQIHFIEAPGDKLKIYAGRLPISAQRSVNGYEAIKKYAEKRGVSIINSTRGGSLEVFPRENLESVLSK